MEKLQVQSKGLEKVIRCANDIMNRRGHSVLTETGISDSQLNVLITLAELGPLTMGELCKMFFTACSTGTDLANRLEREEFVERIRDDKDHRIVRLHLLPKGKEMAQVYIQERQHFLNRVLEEYSSQEYEVLRETLGTFGERIEKLNKTISED